jgi:predicted Zn-dependent protease
MLWRMFCVLFVAVSMLILGGCQTNAATGRSQFQFFSRAEEISLGAQSQPQLVQEFGGTVPDQQLQAYVTEIGKRLASVTEADNPSLPWEFTFLNSDVINAFALPGGKVFVSRGLVKQMKDESELAHVLGHEVGHVTARHTNERMGQALGAQIIAGVAGAAARNQAIAEVAANAAQVAVLGFSREQENEADALGMRYMTRLNYDPRGALGVMQILLAASDGPRQPQMLATHPYPEERIKRVQRELDTTYASMVNNPQYERHTERFRMRMLSRLAMLPPPPDAVDRTALADGGVVLSSPETWCGHCRASAALSELARIENAVAAMY